MLEKGVHPGLHHVHSDAGNLTPPALFEESDKPDIKGAALG
jgi:hypothetical protein